MRSAIDFGVYIPQVAYSYGDLLAQARRVEEGGISSLWFYDHLYTPGLPSQDALEGWTLATAILAQTTALRVGHLVLNNNFRHPVLLARMATTLDIISGGRLNVGIGSGSYELEHHEGGFPWGTLRERTDRLEEALEILTRMFTSERTSFAGRDFTLQDVPNLPQPQQRPHPPIYVGGVGKRYTLPLVARFADVWNVPTYGLGGWEEASHALDEECGRIGRDPASVRRSLEAVLAVAPDEQAAAEVIGRAERRYHGEGWGLAAGGFTGTVSQVTDRIGAWIDRGFTEIVFFPADRGQGAMLQLLAEEIMPAFR
jgi:alkanesulfonate monooxygenase SsuD/methylene tetrahydromethanopterin reductase-like flavin-dependent oxidoreductase (luciferase family)